MILFLVFAANLFGQEHDNPSQEPEKVYFIQQVERDGVLLPEIEIREVTIMGSPVRVTARDHRRNERLIFNVKRVYPYAVIARERLSQVNRELEALETDRERRAYLNEVEKDLFSEFKDDLMRMTITQGRILIKLIDRETQNTSFELIRDYRGRVSAIFWQGIARLFGSNLRAEYDRYGEDAEIEMIILEIEAGRL